MPQERIYRRQNKRAYVPAGEKLITLSKIFNVTIDDLLGGEDEELPSNTMRDFLPFKDTPTGKMMFHEAMYKLAKTNPALSEEDINNLTLLSPHLTEIMEILQKEKRDTSGNRQVSFESNVATMNDAIMIPVVTDDVYACCGSGNIYPDEVKWEIVGYYPMDSSDLIGYTWQTNDFCVIKVSGDSMEPHFNERERVLFVKAPDVEVTSGDFAVMLYQGRLLLRGIIFEKDGRIVLRATNEKYKDIVVPKESDDLCVLGKILGVVPAYRKTPGMW